MQIYGATLTDIGVIVAMFALIHQIYQSNAIRRLEIEQKKIEDERDLEDRGALIYDTLLDVVQICIRNRNNMRKIISNAKLNPDNYSEIREGLNDFKRDNESILNEANPLRDKLKEIERIKKDTFRANLRMLRKQAAGLKLRALGLDLHFTEWLSKT
jgi:hypothetical protein